jgi:hypothetical protein
MTRKSVRECVEEATRCTDRAAASDSPEEARSHLAKAQAWLAIALYRAAGRSDGVRKRLAKPFGSDKD